VTITHGHRVLYIVDSRLKYRRPDGEIEDHGPFRIISRDEDTFLGALSGFGSVAEGSVDTPKVEKI